MVMALILFTAWLSRAALKYPGNRWLPWLLVLASLTVIRVQLGILARNYPISSWKIFSPETLGLKLPLGLAASPADFFISSLLLCVLVYLTLRIFAYNRLRSLGAESPCSPGSRFPIARLIILALASAPVDYRSGPLYKRGRGKQQPEPSEFHPGPMLIARLPEFISGHGQPVDAGNYILKGTPNWPLQAAQGPDNLFVIRPDILFAFWLLSGSKPAEIVFPGLFWLLLTALSTLNWRNWAYGFICLLLLSGFIHSLLREFTELKTRNLTEKVLVHLVSSEKSWASMALRQSFAELQKRSPELLNYFSNPSNPDLARVLWNLTLLARFNWNSCLYLQNQELKLLSSFGLNMPVFAEQTNDLPRCRALLFRNSTWIFSDRKTFPGRLSGLQGRGRWRRQAGHLGQP